MIRIRKSVKLKACTYGCGNMINQCSYVAANHVERSCYTPAGCCCIDEFDKMGSQHQALLEAMVYINTCVTMPVDTGMIFIRLCLNMYRSNSLSALPKQEWFAVFQPEHLS